MNKSTKDFFGRYIKDPKKLDQLEEEWDDKADFLHEFVKGDVITRVVCLIAALLLGLYFWILGE